MEFSLDQRLYNMRVSKKELFRECKKRGRKVSYDTVRMIINEPDYPVRYELRRKIIQTIEELEKEKGITDIMFC